MSDINFKLTYIFPMRLIITLLLLFSSTYISAEVVYKTVDENGNLIFSDKPQTDAEEITLKKLQTVDNPNPATYRTPITRPTLKNESNVYKKIIVMNPADGAGIRNNAGNVSISIYLEPSLRQGDTIVITLDGKKIANGSSTSVSVDNVERGTHGIGASVLNQAGKKVISTTSSFTLLRASK